MNLRLRWIKTGAAWSLRILGGVVLALALVVLALGTTMLFEMEEALAQPGRSPLRIFDSFDVDAGTFVYCDVSDPNTPFLACNTGGSGNDANDGWVGVRGMSEKRVTIRVDAIALTSGNIEFTIEGRSTDDEGNRVTADLIAVIQKTAVAAGQPVRVVEDYDEIRVGVRINGVDDGDAVDEDITVHIFAF